MYDPAMAPDATLDPLRSVVRAVLDVGSGLAPSDLMVVGARARDIIHAALGHTTPTTTTSDLDLALGLRSWTAYQRIIAEFPPTPGNANDIRYTIADCPTDLLVFGAVEDPPGKATPPPRKEPIDVWAFEEIYDSSLAIDVGGGTEIRIPTVAGYTAAKLAAWLDRGAPNDLFVYKDASDIALAMHWYSSSDLVTDLLYDTAAGVLEVEGYDVTNASYHQLGLDVVETVGIDRHRELLARWTADQLETLAEHLALPNERQSASREERLAHRREALGALTRGLADRA
ncbi:hypothetical protein [Nocardioides luteus]|uniref:hypothetical protein n=1 Tax=Nocardioides luteus TaxID=1844 RepID=UPI000593B6CA|nr:hypothetical protein [Nocardioides luteus]MBG6099086.1 putative nucleotidyltransferase [Nocardioides luteus]